MLFGESEAIVGIVPGEAGVVCLGTVAASHANCQKRSQRHCLREFHKCSPYGDLAPMDAV